MFCIKFNSWEENNDGRNYKRRIQESLGTDAWQRMNGEHSTKVEEALELRV